MNDALHPPRIHLRFADAARGAFFREGLKDFPLSPDPPPPASRWSLAHIQLVDLEASDTLQGELRESGEADESLPVLNSTLVTCPGHLLPEMKNTLYQRGFAYVCDSGDMPALRRRFQAMLRVRSRLLAEQAVNRRLKGRLVVQQGRMAQQTDFLHMAVHDLRGPLAAMICYAELLMEGVLGNIQSSQLEPIRTIHRNCQFLVDMVNDLLDTARIDSGKLELKLEKTNFLREVEQAVQSLRSLAEAKDVRLKIEAEPVPDMYLDVQKVGRILSNLLGNAIKFTRSGGEIILRVGRRHHALEFSIQDMGPGIPAADRKAIFEKFNTGSASNVSGKGHGLGLSICKSFVELHGGRIHVESARRKGSVFIVHLPLEKRRAPASPRARKALILDLAGDVPGLETLAGLSADGLRCEVLRGDPEAPLERRSADFLLVNEPTQPGAFGGDFGLLRLCEEKSAVPAGLLVPAEMPEEDRELRRNLGFRLLEKPCTPQDIFDKLQDIVGQDRRHRGR